MPRGDDFNITYTLELFKTLIGVTHESMMASENPMTMATKNPDQKS